MQTYDAIIIGAGHNGLVTTAYLAKAGKKVLALERRPLIGGAAATEEIYPGFKYSTCAYVGGALHPRIMRDLELKRNGLEILPLDPMLFTPDPDGNHLLIWRDLEKAAAEIRRFSREDAENYPRFTALVQRLAGLMKTSWTMTPPDPYELKSSSPTGLMKLGSKFLSLGPKGMRLALRVLPMCVADFLNEWFESEILKATLGAAGILGTFLGPRAQGTSYILLHHAGGDGDANFGARGYIRGGTGKLSSAIAETARRYGADIKVEAEVAEVIIKDGRATGVRLRDGSEISANAVISSADCRQTFLRLVNPTYLDPHFALQVKNIKYRGACAKINLALDGLPDFKSLPGSKAGPQHRGLIRIGPSLDYLEQAFDEAKYGNFSKRPFLEIAIPSVVDDSLAPPGKHVMSVLMQYAPYGLKQGDWRQKREELGDLVVETIQTYAPNFKNLILHRQVLTPLDLEETYALTEGNIHHGELSLDQLFLMRPIPGWARYRTPIRNLYLCGTSAHPGGGLTGLPGHNAAREILRDWRNAKMQI